MCFRCYISFGMVYLKKIIMIHQTSTRLTTTCGHGAKLPHFFRPVYSKVVFIISHPHEYTAEATLLLRWYLGVMFWLKMYFYLSCSQTIFFWILNQLKPLYLKSYKSPAIPTTVGGPDLAILQRSSSWKVKWRRSSHVPLAPIEAFKAKPVCLEHHWATLSVTGLGLSSLETNRWNLWKCWEILDCFTFLGDGSFRKSRVDLCNSWLMSVSFTWAFS